MESLDRRMVRMTYEVAPRPRQADPFDQPDEWIIQKGNSTVQTFTNKRQATSRAKELAKNQEATLAVYDAAKKSSDEFDYRSDEEKKTASRRANRNSVNFGF